MEKKISTIQKAGILTYFIGAILFLTGLMISSSLFWAAQNNLINLNPTLSYLTGFGVTIIIGVIMFLFAQQYDKSFDIANQLSRTIKKQNIRLKELEDFKEDFLTILSHQLKTPLTAIGWSSEVLRDTPAVKNDTDTKEAVSQIITNQLKINRLVNAILTLAKADSDKVAVTIEEVNIVDEIKKTIEPMRVISEAESIEIVFTSELSNQIDPRIKLDLKIFEHVLTNIIDNSIKYSKSKSKILVNLTQLDSNYLIFIKDFGIGIPEGEESKVFTKYERASNVDEETGSGIGMYLSKKLLRLAGANIEIIPNKIFFESTSEEPNAYDKNEGTAFVITIPIKGMISKDGEFTFSE